MALNLKNVCLQIFAIETTLFAKKECILWLINNAFTGTQSFSFYLVNVSKWASFPNNIKILCFKLP